jgi:hypothetical protein
MQTGINSMLPPALQGTHPTMRRRPRYHRFPSSPLPRLCRLRRLDPLRPSGLVSNQMRLRSLLHSQRD